MHDITVLRRLNTVQLKEILRLALIARVRRGLASLADKRRLIEIEDELLQLRVLREAA